MPKLNLKELLNQASGQPSTSKPQAGLSFEPLLAAGQSEYKQGQLERAAQSLTLATRANPDSAPAEHLLGNVHQDLGRLDRAIECYREALRLDPQLSSAENDLGTAYFAKGLLNDAADAFRHCVGLDPSNHRAYENLGSVLRKQGQFGPARRAYQRALWARFTGPLRRLFGSSARDRAPERRGVGLAERMQEAYRAGYLDEAEQLSSEILGQRPDDAGALQVRAMALNRREQYAVALPILEKLVRQSPDSFNLHDALGATLRGMRQYDAALESFNRSLTLNPAAAVTHSNIAALMYDRGRYAQAEVAARTALQIDPELVPAMANLGATLLAQGRIAEAAVELRRALEHNPESLKARLHLCEVLRIEDRYDEVRAELERVREIDPNIADRHLHLGILAQDLDHDVAAALAHFRAAQRLAPQHPSPVLNEAVLRLMNGEFSREVWDLYESRMRMTDRFEVHRMIGLPAWNGAKLGPGELLVYGEQGLGDEIMFVSMLPQAIALAPRLRLAVQPRLRSLVARSFPDTDVIGWDYTSGRPDPGSAKYAIAIGSLGKFFRCSRQDFPQHSGYLKPDPDRLSAMRACLEALGPSPRIGISWQGGVPLTQRVRRSMGLEQLLPILQHSGIRWVSLQYGRVAEEIGKLERDTGVRIENLHDATNDFEDAAALTCALDLVISVCNTSVHLCGALGKPAWVLTPFSTEWRYGIAGSRTPWYPSVELFRQPRPGDWDSVIAQIGARLDSL